MTIVNPLHPIVKHGDEHDEEDHGNWADGITPEERAPEGHGVATLNPLKGERKPGGVPTAVYLNPQMVDVLDPDAVSIYPSVGSHVFTPAVLDSLLLDRVHDYDTTPMKLRDTLKDLLLNDAETMYEDLNAKGATGKWHGDLQDQPGWMRQENGDIVAEYRDSYESLIEEDGAGKWRWKEGAGQALRERDRFYASWHEKYFGLMDRLNSTPNAQNIDVGQIVAAAAVISPQLDAYSNYNIAAYISELVTTDHVITDADRTAYKDKLGEYVEMLKNPFKPDKDKNGEFIKKTPELHKVHLAKAADYEARSAVIDTAVNFSDLGTDSMVQARMAWSIKMAEEGVGFPVGRTWKNFENAFDILYGRQSVDDALGGSQGIKVRSFFNNIIDPYNSSHEDHLTVDFQTVDAALGMTGSEDITDVTNSGAVVGIGFGIRPFVGDAVRSLTYGDDMKEFNAKWGITNSAEMQEVVWAAWKRKISTEGAVPSITDRLGKLVSSKPASVEGRRTPHTTRGLKTKAKKDPKMAALFAEREAEAERLLIDLRSSRDEVFRLGGDLGNVTGIGKAFTNSGLLNPVDFSMPIEEEDESDEWEARLYSEDSTEMLDGLRDAANQDRAATANRILTTAMKDVEKHAVHNQKDHGNRYGVGEEPKRGDEVMLRSEARSKYGFSGSLRAVVENTREPDYRRARQGYSQESVQVRLIEQHSAGEDRFPTRFLIDPWYIAEGPLSTGHPDRPFTNVEKGALSGKFADNRQHRNSLIRRLKRKRKYGKPQRQFGSTAGSRSTFRSMSKPKPVKKHYGPGPHESGSPQSDHGRRGPTEADQAEALDIARSRTNLFELARSTGEGKHPPVEVSFVKRDDVGWLGINHLDGQIEINTWLDEFTAHRTPEHLASTIVHELVHTLDYDTVWSHHNPPPPGGYLNDMERLAYGIQSRFEGRSTWRSEDEGYDQWIDRAIEELGIRFSEPVSKAEGQASRLDEILATREGISFQEAEQLAAKPVKKHGQGSHDDETHGDWADGTAPEDEGEFQRQTEGQLSFYWAPSSQEVVSRWAEQLEIAGEEPPEGWTPAVLSEQIAKMGVDEVSEPFREAVNGAVTKVFNEPEMSAFLDKFGYPQVFTAVRVDGGGDSSGMKGQYLELWGQQIVVYENVWTEISTDPYYTDNPENLQWHQRDKLNLPNDKGNLPIQVGDGLAPVIRHEIGHYIHQRLSDTQGRRWHEISAAQMMRFGIPWGGLGTRNEDDMFEWYQKPDMTGEAVSVYSLANQRETFAETFAAVTHPEFDRSIYGLEAGEMLDFMAGLAQ
jgi:hypothetical protein